MSDFDQSMRAAFGEELAAVLLEGEGAAEALRRLVELTGAEALPELRKIAERYWADRFRIIAREIALGTREWTDPPKLSPKAVSGALRLYTALYLGPDKSSMALRHLLNLHRDRVREYLEGLAEMDAIDIQKLLAGDPVTRALYDGKEPPLIRPFVTLSAWDELAEDEGIAAVSRLTSKLKDRRGLSSRDVEDLVVLADLGEGREQTMAFWALQIIWWLNRGRSGEDRLIDPALEARLAEVSETVVRATYPKTETARAAFRTWLSVRDEKACAFFESVADRFSEEQRYILEQPLTRERIRSCGLMESSEWARFVIPDSIRSRDTRDLVLRFANDEDVAWLILVANWGAPRERIAADTLLWFLSRQRETARFTVDPYSRWPTSWTLAPSQLEPRPDALPGARGNFAALRIEAGAARAPGGPVLTEFLPIQAEMRFPAGDSRTLVLRAGSRVRCDAVFQDVPGEPGVQVQVEIADATGSVFRAEREVWTRELFELAAGGTEVAWVSCDPLLEGVQFEADSRNRVPMLGYVHGWPDPFAYYLKHGSLTLDLYRACRNPRGESESSSDRLVIRIRPTSYLAIGGGLSSEVIVQTRWVSPLVLFPRASVADTGTDARPAPTSFTPTGKRAGPQPSVRLISPPESRG